MVGNAVVDVLQKNDIRIQRIQIGKERPVPAGAEDQLPFVVPKRSVSRIHRQGVCRLFLRGDPDLKDRPGARFIIPDYLDKMFPDACSCSIETVKWSRAHPCASRA